MLSRLAAAAVLVALVACSPAPPTTQPPPDTGSVPAPSVPLPAGLPLGEPAEVAYAAQVGPTTLQVTVSGIERGDAADLAELELPPEQADGTPFYARATIVHAGEQDLQFEDPALRLTGLDDRGRPVTPVVITTRFRPCDYVAAPEGYAPGESFDTCVTYVVPDGGSLAGVQWEQPGSPPVLWRG